MEPIEIPALAEGATLGRGETCVLRMPADADQVSRQHVRFIFDHGAWRIADLASRWGTFLNGVKLAAQREVPLGDGDLLRIAPWTFHFSTRGVPERALMSEDDSGTHATLVRSFAAPAADSFAPPPMAENLLTLLLESAAAVHAAEDEAALATALIDTAMRGTGLTNAALLRPLDAEGRLEVIAAKQSGHASGAPAGYSRSLIAAAGEGSVAELSTGSDDISQSIVQMGITSAICAPVMLGGAVAAYLYLDNRGGSSQLAAPRKGGASFCLTLARMAGLALANMKRMEIEKRQAALEYDLSAAAKAQKWILPKRITSGGRLTCTGESRAGAYLGGDFFDVIPLDDNRMVVALGDVSGHGVAASVLMTAAQGFLHAALRQNESVAEAVTQLNRFIFPRRPDSSFMTLWVGVFDLTRSEVTYVNAGHGYAMLLDPASKVTMLDGGEDLPIGFDKDAIYASTTTPLPAAGRALILSDGIIEQFDPGRSGSREQFGVSGVISILTAAPQGDIIADMFQAVFRHAESENLQDDATAVMVNWV